MQQTHFSEGQLVSQDGMPLTLSDVASGGWYKLGESVLTASAASIDFNNIPQTYKHLRLILSLRSDVAATFDTQVIAINGDTTDANYRKQVMSAAAATVTAAESTGAAQTRSLMGIPGGTATAGRFGDLECTIINYTKTDRPPVLQAIGAVFYTHGAGFYSISQIALTRITAGAVTRLTLTTGNAANFVAGSVASLYGVKSGF